MRAAKGGGEDPIGRCGQTKTLALRHTGCGGGGAPRRRDEEAVQAGVLRPKPRRRCVETPSRPDGVMRRPRRGEDQALVAGHTSPRGARRAGAARRNRGAHGRCMTRLDRGKCRPFRSAKVRSPHARRDPTMARRAPSLRGTSRAASSNRVSPTPGNTGGLRAPESPRRWGAFLSGGSTPQRRAIRSRGVHRGANALQATGASLRAGHHSAQRLRGAVSGQRGFGDAPLVSRETSPRVRLPKSGAVAAVVLRTRSSPGRERQNDAPADGSPPSACPLTSLPCSARLTAIHPSELELPLHSPSPSQLMLTKANSTDPHRRSRLMLGPSTHRLDPPAPPTTATLRQPT